MADVPPNIDELKRVDECLRRCGAKFLACEDVWQKLATQKKITEARAFAEFRKCRKADRECRDACIPEKRRFGEGQKPFLSDATIELEGIAAVGIIAAVGAAALFGAPAIVFRIIVLFSGVAAGVGLGYQLLVVDPIDPNFSKLPIPSFPKLPTVRPIRNTRLPASFATAANAVQTNQAQAIGLLNAMRTALDRSNSAAFAGDTSAEERQLKAARGFAKKLADVYRDAGALRLKLASKWTGPGVDFTISAQDALKLRDDIIINDLPRQFFDALKMLGFDQKERDSIRQSLIISLANLQGLQQIRFRDLLIDPKLRAAEMGLITLFEQFSRSR